jgi:FtsZ-interacting cell division protein ZipA
MSENNAKSKSPTSNEKGDVSGSVKIISKEVASVDNKEFISNTEDIIMKNSVAEEQLVTDGSIESSSVSASSSENVNMDSQQSDTGSDKEGIISRISRFLKSLLNRSSRGSGNNGEGSMEPENLYQINVRRSNGEPISAMEAIQICERFNLALGEHDIYYCFDPKSGNEVFRVCGSTEPYGFAKSYKESVSYDAICLFMPLPDRGFAENSYCDMAAFAYKFATLIKGEMIDNNKKPIGEQFILHHREVLAAYDKLR